MTSRISILAATLAAVLASAGGARAATVFIPEGSAGEVLVVDATTDSVRGRVGGLEDVHGLGGAARARYLVAGSYAERPTAGAAAIERPAGVSEDEHAAHHGGGTRPATAAGGAVSILAMIDPTSLAIVQRREVPGAVHHVAVSPDGRYAVATHPNADGVSVVDLSDFSVRNPIRTGTQPNYAVFSPDGSRVYVSNAGNGTVSEIDTRRWFVRRNLLAGDTPEHLVMAADGQRLYVANVEAGTVSELSLASGEIARSFALGGTLHGLDLSDDSTTLFATVIGTNRLAAIDLRSGRVRSAELAPAPYHLTAIRGTGKLYVSSRQEPTVWVIDQASLRPRGEIAIRGEGHQMVVLP